MPVGATVPIGKPLHSQDDAHGRRYADGRRAANAQIPNRFPDLLHRSAVTVFQPGWQQSLIDQPDESVAVADPGDGAWGRHVKVRGQRSEVRGRKSEVGSRISRFGNLVL